MRLSSLLDGQSVRWLQPGDADIRSVTVDHREVAPGTLYAACRGYYGDGHDRIPAALDRGAAALVVTHPECVPPRHTVPVAVVDERSDSLGEISARFYGNPTAELRVFGVTGTNGKTSVAYLLEHVLRALGERPALMGTIEYRFEGQTHPACNTTPDALFVQRFARRALEAGATSLVLEVSSHALALHRTGGVLFDRVGFTNLTHDHLDFHGTMEEYRRAKEKLFRACLDRSVQAGKAPLAAAIVDEPVGRQMLQHVPPSVATLAISTTPGAPPADLAVETIATDGAGQTRFRVTSRSLTHTGVAPLIGRHNVANLTLAAAMAAGNDPDRLATALASSTDFAGVRGRLERVDVGDESARVFVDYAHTPDALERALEELSRLDDRPVTVVVGCGGDRDRSKRPAMAEVARRGAALAIFTSDNPRGEDPEAILDDMQGGASASSKVARIADRSAAIERAMTTAHRAVVLIAGKGHERYQERGGARFRLDDREEARRAAAAIRLSTTSARTPLLLGWSRQRRARLLAGEHAEGSVCPEIHVAPDGTITRVQLGAHGCTQGYLRLMQELLNEARARPDGLWTAWWLAEPASPAKVCTLLSEGAAASPPLLLRPSPHVEEAEAMASLTPSHRGVVLLAGENGLPADANTNRALAPDLVVAETDLATALERHAPQLPRAPELHELPRLTPTELGALSTAERAGLLASCRAQARRRRATRFEPRPIPVPDGLRLEAKAAPAR